MSDIFEFLNGKIYSYNGLDGIFQHKKYKTKHHGTIERLYHEKTEKAKESPEYLKIKYELGDDWSSDLTNDIETVCNIALELGYIYES